MSKFYSANEVTLVVGGLPIDAGLADDTFVEIEAFGPNFTIKTGIDGESAICEQKDRTHKVTVHLMQTGDGNDKLSAILLAAEASGGGTAGVVPFVLKDNQGTTILMATDSVIEGWPKQAYAKDAGAVDWTIFVMAPKRFVGGNAGT